MEKKSLISVALNSAEIKTKNEEKSKFFVTKKDGKYTVNNLPLLMKSMEKNCTAFLSIIVDKNGGKSVTAKQTAHVINAILNNEKVLDLVKAL